MELICIEWQKMRLEWIQNLPERYKIGVRDF
jgi:hypothetical protein